MQPLYKFMRSLRIQNFIIFIIIIIIIIFFLYDNQISTNVRR